MIMQQTRTIDVVQEDAFVPLRLQDNAVLGVVVDALEPRVQQMT